MRRFILNNKAVLPTALSLLCIGCMTIQPNSIPGHYHCHGADAEAGQYDIHDLTITQDVQVTGSPMASYDMQIKDINTREGGSYRGHAIVDLHQRIGANFIGHNRNKPKDYGAGLMRLDKFDRQQAVLQQFTIHYYEPAYHLNGQYVCMRRNGP